LDFSFFYDISEPENSLTFFNDIFKQDLDLYTSKKKPTFNIEMSSPKYRVFNCNISSTFNGQTYTKNSIKSINKIINFPITDINENINLNLQNPENISFSCTDNYGEFFKKNFKLHFDNVKPILNSVSLRGGNRKLITSGSGIHYNKIEDDLIFSFVENKKILNCYYKISSFDKFYTCDPNYTKISMNSEDIEKKYKSIPKTFVSGSNNEGGICSIKVEPTNNFNFKKELFIDSYCVDGSNLTSNHFITKLDLIYSDNVLFEMDFEYSDKKAYPIIYTKKKLNELTPLIISTSNNIEDKLFKLNDLKKEYKLSPRLQW